MALFGSKRGGNDGNGNGDEVPPVENKECPNSGNGKHNMVPDGPHTLKCSHNCGERQDI